MIRNIFRHRRLGGGYFGGWRSLRNTFRNGESLENILGGEIGETKRKDEDLDNH